MLNYCFVVPNVSMIENNAVGVDLPEIQISEQLSLRRVELSAAF